MKISLSVYKRLANEIAKLRGESFPLNDGHYTYTQRDCVQMLRRSRFLIEKVGKRYQLRNKYLHLLGA